MQISVNKKSFILRVKPELVISGHLHENARKEDEIGKIKIIKCWAFWYNSSHLERDCRIVEYLKKREFLIDYGNR